MQRERIKQLFDNKKEQFFLQISSMSFQNNHITLYNESKSINTSKYSSRLNSIGAETNFVAVSPLKIRCLSSSKHKQRRSATKLFNAAHQIRNSETYLAPHFSEFCHLTKPSEKRPSPIHGFSLIKDKKIRLNIFNQFSIKIQGETTLSMIIQDFQQPNGLTEILEKQNDQNSHNFVNQPSKLSAMSLLCSLQGPKILNKK